MKATILFIELFFVIVLVLLNLGSMTNGHWAGSQGILHDPAVFVVAAISHNEGLGVPYKDYWDYRPPGFFFLLDLWVKIFGSQIFSFKALETLFRLLVGIQICFVVRSVFPSLKSLFVTLFTLAAFFSPIFGVGWYSEVYGISFSLTGLLCLFYIKKISLRFFLAGLFFSISMQMKDIFGGAILAVFPPIFFSLLQKNYRSFVKASVFLILGYIFPIIFLGFYLLKLGSLGAYFEVLGAKSANRVSVFNDFLFFAGHYYITLKTAKNVLTFFQTKIPYVFLLLTIATLICFVRCNLMKLKIISSNKLIISIPSLKFKITLQTLNILIIALYSLGSFIIISLAYNFSSPHYLFPFNYFRNIQTTFCIFIR